MEIRTKFNVNDEVWFCGWNTEEKRWKIAKIKIIDIFNPTPSRILYFADFGNTNLLNVEEQDCFATKEEALKECYRRNTETI